MASPVAAYGKWLLMRPSEGRMGRPSSSHPLGRRRWAPCFWPALPALWASCSTPSRPCPPHATNCAPSCEIQYLSATIATPPSLPSSTSCSSRWQHTAPCSSSASTSVLPTTSGTRCRATMRPCTPSCVPLTSWSLPRTGMALRALSSVPMLASMAFRAWQTPRRFCGPFQPLRPPTPWTPWWRQIGTYTPRQGAASPCSGSTS
mmetsp:Transcript_2510/g.7152  ORF Transcript_2510/g.7152 Transcript_2510/m.7152 type:complete len:204 (-) Transcript_2510:327-938(-)